MPDQTLDQLEHHYFRIQRLIIEKQDPITGLLPASTAINIHGDYTDAWIRDNVYCILAVWGLSRAYHRHIPQHQHSYQLEKSVVRLMRGLLKAMMQQADRVEAFKYSLDPKDSIHAKFGTRTGQAVVGDSEWGHLQLDAVSLYLLQLVQMIASGISLIYSADEVNFIQNLVHYISRTYCTPDYGIWERGNKTNRGIPEINASSVGMAKAALESLAGFNLFGNVPSSTGIIHVVPSDIARSRFTLQGLLPRESNSKETDAALLSIIGFPAYAIEDKELIKETRDKILQTLQGRYGCKRFLLDGHQSALEDESRLHYEPSELQKFRDIESEWPLFFCYLMLDGLMTGRNSEAAQWREKLQPLFVEQAGLELLPELYRVPVERIEAEKNQPGSQSREANENLPLTWAQSLFILADMIEDGTLHPAEIDPLHRRQRPGHHRSTSLLVPIFAENEAVRQNLLNRGISTETLAQISPVQVFHAAELAQVHTYLGKNQALGLSGRPALVMRTLTTSRLFEITGQRMIFLPYYFNPGEFYLSHDNHLLVEQFRSSVRFIAENWDQPGQPLVSFLVRADMLNDDLEDPLMQLLSDLTRGQCDGVDVITGRLDSLLTTACLERITYLHDYRFPDALQPARVGQAAIAGLDSDSLQPADLQRLYESEQSTLIEQFAKTGNRLLQAEILRILIKQMGPDARVDIGQGENSLMQLCRQLYDVACVHHHWSLVRRMADLMNLCDSRIEDTLLEIIIRRKRLSVGRAYSEQAVISHPLSSERIIERIRTFSGKTAAESILTQEVMLHLGHLLKSRPALFQDMLTLRVRHFVQLLVASTARDESLNSGAAYERILTFAPSRIFDLLQHLLQTLNEQSGIIQQQEHLQAAGLSPTLQHGLLDDGEFAHEEAGQRRDWTEWRQHSGGLVRLSESDYHEIYQILSRCNGLIIGDKYSLGSRISHDITHDMTAGEPAFAMLVEAELNQIDSPAYRQLNIEMLQTLIRVFRENPQLEISGDIVLDVIIGHAVKIAWLNRHDGHYDEQREQAWQNFYALPPSQVRKFSIDAIGFLLE